METQTKVLGADVHPNTSSDYHHYRMFVLDFDCGAHWYVIAR